MPGIEEILIYCIVHTDVFILLKSMHLNIFNLALPSAHPVMLLALVMTLQKELKWHNFGASFAPKCHGLQQLDFAVSETCAVGIIIMAIALIGDR